MKLRHLHAQLEAVEAFRSPKVMLEQYPTGPEVAANCIYIMHQSFDAIKGKAVGDLGCGCGMLSIACALMGAASIVGYELDSEAAEVMCENIKEMELGRIINIVMCDVTSLLLKQPATRVSLSSISSPTLSSSSSISSSSSTSSSSTPTSSMTSAQDEFKKLSLKDNNEGEEEEESDAEEEQNTQDTKSTKKVRSPHARGKKTRGHRGKAGGRGGAKTATPRERQHVKLEDTEPDEIGVDWIKRWSLPPVKLFDTVITNPPFGTREKGVDMIFVQVGLQLSRNSVFSFHKASTRDHILRKAAQWGVNAQVLTSIRFDIPQMYSFHNKASKDIEVDFIRFSHRKTDH